MAKIKTKSKKISVKKKAAQKKIVVKTKKKAVSQKKTGKKKVVAKVLGTRIPVKNIRLATEVVESPLSQEEISLKQIPVAANVYLAEDDNLGSADLGDATTEDYALVFGEETFLIGSDQPVVNDNSLPEMAPAADLQAEEDEEAYMQNGFSWLSAKQKQVIMYVSISVIMVAIVSFWAVGIRSSLGLDFQNALNQNEQGASAEQTEILDAVWQLRQGVEQMTQQATDSQAGVNEFIDQTEQKIIETQMKNEVTDKLKAQIESLNVNQAPNLNTLTPNINSGLNSNLNISQ